MASVGNPSLMGLQYAVDDPLGTNLKRRGLDAYNAEARKSDPRYASGPLPDPAWEGLFQAMADQHVTRVGQDAARPEGLADDPTWAAQGDVGQLAGTGDHIPVAPLMRSNNIARPVRRR